MIITDGVVMIIDFTVANYRSIKDEQTVCFYPEKKDMHLEASNVYKCKTLKQGILRSVGIYGANASGKTNLLRALLDLECFVRNSSRFEDGKGVHLYAPYKLSASTQKAPCLFEIEFKLSESDDRYRYRVRFDQKIIREEKLWVYKTAKKALLFSRGKSGDAKDIEYGSLLTGGGRLFSVFANQLYLSKAGNDADAPEILRKAYRYFSKDIAFFNMVPCYETTFDLVKNSGLREKIGQLLASVDTGVVGVVGEERKLEESEFGFPVKMPQLFRRKIMEEERYQNNLSHVNEKGEEIQFQIEEESAGTRFLFKAAPILFDALATGGTVVFDELERNFHPHISDLIVRLFNNPKINHGNGQLIFTTHNPRLMRPELVRRDQTWFVEKGKGASEFYSLAEFDKHRKIDPIKHPFDQWYLDGCYESVPKIDYNAIELLFGEKINAEKEK